MCLKVCFFVRFSNYHSYLRHALDATTLTFKQHFLNWNKSQSNSIRGSHSGHWWSSSGCSLRAVACWGVEAITWAQPTVRIPLPEMPDLFHYNVRGAPAVWRIFIWRKLNGTVGPAMQPRTKCQPVWLCFCRWLGVLQDGRQQGRWADSVWLCTALWAVRSICSAPSWTKQGSRCPEEKNSAE